jgi:two-component system sensor histidine kinase DctS
MWRHWPKGLSASRAAFQVATGYLVAGLLWILLSGRAVDAVASDQQQALALEAYKGYLFIAVTALLLYLLLYAQLSRLLAVEEKAHEHREQFRHAFEDSITGMALVSPDLRYLRVNRVLCEMLGFDEAELLERSILDVTHPVDRASRESYLRELLLGGPPRLVEVRLVRRDGAVLRVLANSTLVRDPSGEPAYFVSQVVDVTALREAEEQSLQQQAAMAHSARMISVGELSSNLAHEMNQPLGAILHYGETCRQMLADNGSLPREALLEAMEDVVRQADRARQVVQRVREAARKRDPQAVSADINAIVRDAATMLSPQLRRFGVALRLELAEDVPAVAADPVQIGQVLTNLAINGIEAVSQLPMPRRWLALRTWIENDRVCVGVRDGGEGVSEEAASRLFDSFFTTKPTGLGLGLAISRSIVEAHGGKLSMTRGKGWTEFQFHLLEAEKATWLLQGR